MESEHVYEEFSSSSSPEVQIGWFKMLCKEEKEDYNFTIGHFLKFPSLLGEKMETS